MSKSEDKSFKVHMSSSYSESEVDSLKVHVSDESSSEDPRTSEGAQWYIQTEHLTGSGISVMHRWLLGPPEACKETPTPCATWWGWEGVEAH